MVPNSSNRTSNRSNRTRNSHMSSGAWGQDYSKTFKDEDVSPGASVTSPTQMTLEKSASHRLLVEQAPSNNTLGSSNLGAIHKASSVRTRLRRFGSETFHHRAEEAMAEDDTTSTPEQQIMANEMSRVMRRSKWVLYIFLFVVAVVACVMTYVWLSNEQEESFERDFELKAGEIGGVFRRQRSSKFDASEDFALTISSQAKHSGQQFPNVVLSDFERIAKHARKTAQAELAMWIPVVPTVNQTSYEAFVQEHADHWIHIGLEDQGFNPAEDATGHVPDEIHDLLELEVEGAGHHGHGHGGHGDSHGGHGDGHGDMNHGDGGHGDMNHGDGNHGDMNHGDGNHGDMNHGDGGMNHGDMNHGDGGMNHGDMNHTDGGMNHGDMNHTDGGMNHSDMNHTDGGMNHGDMNSTDGHMDGNHSNVMGGMTRSLSMDGMNHGDMNHTDGGMNHGDMNHTDGGMNHGDMNHTDGGMNHGDMNHTDGGMNHGDMNHTDGGMNHGDMNHTDGGMNHGDMNHTDGGIPFQIQDDGFQLLNILAPVWQTEPAPINATVINADLLLDQDFSGQTHLVFGEKSSAFSRFRVWGGLTKHFVLEHDRAMDMAMDDMDNSNIHPDESGHQHVHRRASDSEQPYSYVLTPVYWDMNEKKGLVGFTMLLFRWVDFFDGLRSSATDGIDVVIDDSCGSVYTYELQKDKVVYKGQGDFHDSEYDSHLKRVSLEEVITGEHLHQTCTYVLELYPTASLEESHVDNDPIRFAIAIGVIFVFLFIVFVLYDWAVLYKQGRVVLAAQKTQAIVSSVFPKNVRERLLDQVDDPNPGPKDYVNTSMSDLAVGTAARRRSSGFGDKKSSPIADLFPDATVFFADIAGFTAWSSTREPAQVFELLEVVYGAFDDLARRHRIFKVETVGDCYVAVAGLPEPRQDHAVAMVHFSSSCLAEFSKATKDLVKELGPDTEDLGLRIGLHTGPVTAGVLRGEKARFQLFGDTVNTAARMESNGVRNRIHASEETAATLRSFNKTNWLRLRADTVVAKGKGALQTYWIVPDRLTMDFGRFEADSDEASAAAGGAAPVQTSVVDKYSRLVGWNCDVLSKILKQMVARRESLHVNQHESELEDIHMLEKQLNVSRNVLHEVKEVVGLPHYKKVDQMIDPGAVDLGKQVEVELERFVRTLAAMYRDNPFHNFEHASHVTMSVTKLLSRIVAPDKLLVGESEEALHDHTYGITSDPMTQFALVFSALIHDADHPGVPNTRLIEENPALAKAFDGKSVAEQNSVCLAWDLLMQDDFKALRNVIYVSKAEFLRFRQLVVQIVLATDIMDKDLGAQRKQRWQKAFAGNANNQEEEKQEEGSESIVSKEDVDRKATIVMEHLIQASDVAHTMQHWHVFLKWNKRLFHELYDAFLQGRSEKDPSQNWYEGEKGFYDFYVIPLAKKLKDCGVFGVSSDEYLQYAMQNRREWEHKGQDVVASMVEEYREAEKSRSNQEDSMLAGAFTAASKGPDGDNDSKPSGAAGAAGQQKEVATTTETTEADDAKRTVARLLEHSMD